MTFCACGDGGCPTTDPAPYTDPNVYVDPERPAVDTEEGHPE